MSTGKRRQRPGGFSYLALLFAMALIGTALGVAGQVWHLQMQREKEAQLIWVGHQYRRAFELYWKATATRNGPVGANGFGVANGVVSGGGGAAVAAGGAVPGGVPGGSVGGSVTGSPDPNASGTSQPSGFTGQPLADGSGANAVAGGGSPGLPGAPVAGIPGVGIGMPGPGGSSGGKFPSRLEDLLTDPRFQQVRHYLRRLYPDPVTGKNDWVPVIAPGGGIMGVRSASEAKPVKQDNFSPADIAFTGKSRYSDWVFSYTPPSNSRRPTVNTSGYVQSPVGGTTAAPSAAPTAPPAGSVSPSTM